MNAKNQTIKRLGSVRAVLLMFCVALCCQTIGAATFIKDVMLIGGTKDETNNLKTTLTAQGWNVINMDLNAGAGGDYIYLLYKSEDSDGNNYGYVTDFYIKGGSEGVNSTLSFGGHTYHLVSYDGGDHFKGQKGDLNSGTGAQTDAIHLYYTKELFPDNHAISVITFNDTKNGAIGKNGGSEGYDLNKGCGASSDYIYMHVSKATALVPALTGNGTDEEPFLIQNAGDWNAFAANVNTGKNANSSYMVSDDYSDQTPITRMVGTQEHPFCGTLYGNGKSVCFNIASTEFGAAPLSYISGAKILNLNTKGTVTGADHHAAGLVGLCNGDGEVEIFDCDVDVDVNGATYAGGIVGHGGHGALTMENCTFRGSINSFKNYAGGLIGWCDEVDMLVTSCMFNGSFNPARNGKYHPIACKNGDSNILASFQETYYINTAFPSDDLGNCYISATEDCLPVSATLIPGDWDDEVPFGDDTYYTVVTPKRLPYNYGFEYGMCGWQVVNGYNHNTAVRTGLKTNEVHEGRYSFKFEYCEHDQYLISPEIDCMAPMTMSLFLKGMSDMNVIVQVGASSTTTDLDEFTWSDPIDDIFSGWGHVLLDVRAGSKYIAIKYISGSSYFYVDDISLEAPYANPENLTLVEKTDRSVTFNWTCSGENLLGYSWKIRKTSEPNNWIDSGTLTEPTITITGLEASTEYIFYVQALYPNDKKSSWLTGTFSTQRPMAFLPYCQDFENGMDGWNLANCASGTGINPEARHDGSYGFLFDVCDNYQYLQSPLFEENKTIRATFYGRITDTSHPASFIVGTSEVDGANMKLSSLLTIDRDGWGRFEMNLPQGALFFFIIWINSADATNKLYIDDINFFDPEDEIGIESVFEDNTQRITFDGNTSIFNLSGQKLQKVQKGINIINGKKILIK